MELFPIGTLGSTSTGEFGSLFEPNKGCSHEVIHTSLVSSMETNLVVTRQKARPYHSFLYSYENIWAREHYQIEQFFRKMKGRVTSFYLVDFSRLQRATAALSGGDYTVTVSGGLSVLNTGYFTTIEGDGGNYCCLWDPYLAKFRIGKVTTIVDSTSIKFSDTGDVGDLTSFANTVVCPLYNVYFAADQLQAKAGEFNPTDDADRGLTQSLDISFVQKGVN